MEEIQQYYERKRQKIQQRLERLNAREHKALEKLQQASRQKAAHSKYSISCFELFWVFFICCFLGVVLETIFVFVRTGHYMQRTGLVWGPFNLIYGTAAVLLTLSLRHFRGKNDRWIFFGGAVIGGAFEYFCSWLQETLTGTVSWDYSNIAFNLNGRINLLYCFFWGILSIVWVKELYPRITGWIWRHLGNRWGVVMAWVLAAFMLANSLVSGGAVLRMAQRYEGVPATSSWQRAMDQHFPDERLKRIYPSMVHTD